MATSQTHEKTIHLSQDSPDPEVLEGKVDDLEEHEVFQKDGEVNFRTVGWPRASVIFLKVIFATGVLSIPTAMVSLGAIGGALNVIGFGMLNTYSGVIT